MQKHKLDNGLLLIAYLSNVLGPVTILAYFGINYVLDPVTNEDNLFIMIPLTMFSLMSFFMVFGFRKVEFDDQYVYVKNVMNREVDTFPVKNIRSVKKMMLSFSGKNTRGKSGKNYKIRYVNNDGVEKKIKVMATIGSDVESEFKKATSFLGADGFNPE